MCLIGLEHRASDRFPLVIAANRDEDYTRPTRDAHFWDDAPEVLGGRDLLLGGSWLAITRSGRFAAVTNLHGAVRSPQNRSRGALVRDFVTSTTSPRVFADEIVRHIDEYTPFHLLIGEIGGDVVHVFEQATLLEQGVYGISNAPLGAAWPKVGAAIDRVRTAIELEDSGAIVEDLLAFLGTTTHARYPNLQGEIFVTGDRYGTRSSTVIVASASEVVFAEKAGSTRSLFRYALRDR